MTNQKIVYLQKGFYGLPAGTPLVECDQPADAQFAAALVGHPTEPATWHRIQGTQTAVRIPLFMGLVDKYHPTAKEVVGPFVVRAVEFSVDKLPIGVSANITLAKSEYPEVVIKVCVNTVLHRSWLIRDELDNLPPLLSVDGDILTREIIRERVEVMLGDEDFLDELVSNQTVRLSSSGVKKERG